jgi:hypothetical protein
MRSQVPLKTALSPDFLYRWLFGNPLTKIFFRGTFRKIGVNNLRWINFSNPAGKTRSAREKLL